MKHRRATREQIDWENVTASVQPWAVNSAATSDEAYYQHRETGVAMAGSIGFGLTSRRTGVHAETLLFGSRKVGTGF